MTPQSGWENSANDDSNSYLPHQQTQEPGSAHQASQVGFSMPHTRCGTTQQPSAFDNLMLSLDAMDLVSDDLVPYTLQH